MSLVVTRAYRTALCAVGGHFCAAILNPTRTGTTATVFHAAMSSFLQTKWMAQRLQAAIHVGTREEIVTALKQKGGLNAECLPRQVGGNWDMRKEWPAVLAGLRSSSSSRSLDTLWCPAPTISSKELVAPSSSLLEPLPLNTKPRTLTRSKELGAPSLLDPLPLNGGPNELDLEDAWALSTLFSPSGEEEEEDSTGRWSPTIELMLPVSDLYKKSNQRELLSISEAIKTVTEPALLNLLTDNDNSTGAPSMTNATNDAIPVALDLEGGGIPSVTVFDGDKGNAAGVDGIPKRSVDDDDLTSDESSGGRSPETMPANYSSRRTGKTKDTGKKGDERSSLSRADMEQSDKIDQKIEGIMELRRQKRLKYQREMYNCRMKSKSAERPPRGTTGCEQQKR